MACGNRAGVLKDGCPGTISGAAVDLIARRAYVGLGSIKGPNTVGPNIDPSAMPVPHIIRSARHWASERRAYGRGKGFC